jgi:hypothetical protein
MMEIILAEEETKHNVCIVILVSVLLSVIQDCFKDLSVNCHALAMNNSVITSRNSEHGIRRGIFFFMILLGKL